MKYHYSGRHSSNLRCRREGGAVLLITLILLVLLLLSTVALMRSSETSLIMAGNLAFKRDLTNQGERGMTKAIAAFKSGALSSSSARTDNLLSSNYFATAQASDSHGLPIMLLKDSAFTGTAGDITDSASGVTIRYMVDRLCNSTGAFDYNTCVSLRSMPNKGADVTRPDPVSANEYRPVYRISVRVTGPRNTQAYLQSTFVN